jgi:hypothetical protein
LYDINTAALAVLAMLTQAQADRLISIAKEAERTDALNWHPQKIENEVMIAVEEKELHFILSMKRNPFEIRLHLRTKDRDIGLVRLDNSRYHPNPDGTEIINKPHLHRYREGYGLEWAEPIDWYNADDPFGTLECFLGVINGHFPGGFQIGMF